MTKDEALRLAMDALEYPGPSWIEARQPAITAIKAALEAKDEPVAIDGNTSDGYHTFNELYEFRKAYNVALFNEWASNGKCSVHKSWRHNDGELCFGGGWFIVVAVLPQGQISNHYEAKDWGLFSVLETERALFEFDGHTGSDVVERLKSYAPPRQEAKDEPVAWMYDWTSDDGEFIQDWTTSMAETLRDTGKTIITNVRPLYLTPQVIHKPLKHLGEIPMAWCRWSEDLGKWMYTHRQPTEELAWIPLYTSPPPVAEPHKRKPLTDEEICDAVRESDIDWHQGWTLDDDEPNRFMSLARAIEAAHGIKGEA